jgi:hypothetical protein
MNVVIREQAKGADRLGPKGKRWVAGLNVPGSWTLHTVGEKRGPSPFIGSVWRNTVSPLLSREGK